MQEIREKTYKLLRWSEKYFKTDMVYLAKGGFWLTFGQIVSSVSSFLLAIAFANLLTQQTFGTYKYLLSTYGLISLLLLPGLATSITHSISRGFEGSLEFGFRKKLSWSLLGSLASFVVSGYYLVNHNLTLAVSFFILGSALPLMETFGLYPNFLEGKKIFKERVVYEIIINLFSAVFIVLTLFLTKNLFILLIVYFASNGLGRLFFYLLTLKKFKENDQLDEKMISYAKSLSALQIVSNAAQYLDKIMLFTILGAPQVAIFTFANAIPERIKCFFRFTGTISFPKFTTRPIDEIKKTLLKKLILLGIIIFLGIIAYILAAPYIFKYLFPKYISAVYFSQVIALTTIYAITYPISSYLTAHKKVKELFIISGSSFLLGLICLLAFIPLYGIWGAVIGLIANRITIMATSFYFLKRIRD